MAAAPIDRLTEASLQPHVGSVAVERRFEKKHHAATCTLYRNGKTIGVDHWSDLDRYGSYVCLNQIRMQISTPLYITTLQDYLLLCKRRNDRIKARVETRKRRNINA